VKAEAGVLSGTIVFEPSPCPEDGDASVCTFDGEIAAAAGLDSRALVQEFQVCVPRGAVRGLHMRTDGGEGRFVRCAHGSVLDVAVDLRPYSPTYRLWMTSVLDDVDHRAVWLPAGMAHGFQALTPTATICSRIDRVHRPEFDASIRYDDPDLGIPWPLPVTGLTARDEHAPILAVLEPMLSQWFGLLG
jgi:dTDP-4-dehydrorhamnose 3,5-epimerase